MAFKSDLQENNIDLQGILDMVNTLPEAGSAGTCMVCLFAYETNVANTTLYWVDAEGVLHSMVGVMVANQYAENIPVGSLCVAVSSESSADISLSSTISTTIIYDSGCILAFTVNEASTDSVNVIAA